MLRLNGILLFSVLAALPIAAQPGAPAPAPTPAAREAAIARLDQHPDARTLQTLLTTIRPGSTASEAQKAQAEKLATDAADQLRAGKNGEARRGYSQAIALLLGKPWDANAEFGDSLVLRGIGPVVDSSTPLLAWLGQAYPAAHKAAGTLHVHATLVDAAPGGKVVKDSGAVEGTPAADMVSDPYRLVADLAGAPDGTYLLVAELTDDSGSIGKVAAPVQMVKDFEAQRWTTEQKLAAIKGHDGTKATIRYPFQLAELAALGKVTPGDYAFATEVHRSADLLKALESGKDLLYQAKGDVRRNYYMAEAGEIIPFRIYVPTTWTPSKKMPIVLTLHGASANEDLMLTRGNFIAEKEAEKHGFIVVSPEGYHGSGGWGSTFGIVSAPRPGGAAGGPGGAPGGAPGAGGGGGRGAQDPAAAAAATRNRELSEKDALNVLDLITKEYNADTKRTYLMGNSMGGAGTWYLGQKYPERWAAIAPSAGPVSVDPYPYERLKGVPILGVHGEKDTTTSHDATEAMIKKAKAAGLDATFESVKDGTHDGAVEIAMPKIFEFFDQHKGR